MTPERRAIRDAWIAECWPVCRELPLGERVQKRKADRVDQRRFEELSTSTCGSPVDGQSINVWTEAG